MARELEASATNFRRLSQEAAETRRRMVIGGSFYLLGWILVCLFTPVVGAYPWTAAAIAALFLGLAAVRIIVRPNYAAGPEPLLRWLDLQWTIIQVSAAVWGGIVIWTLVDPVLEDARMALLVGGAGFATALAHTYCMRFWPSLLAIAAIYLPSNLLMWAMGENRAVAFTLSVYFVYVLSSLMRSHRDFHRRLDFEEELRQQRDRYELMSRTDDLTGLANRREFLAVLERWIGLSKNNKARLALLVLDIDHFKQINDSYGHSIGDRCLVAFAEQLRHVFSGPDELCARLGGEEFAVIVPQHEEALAAERADAFRAGLGAINAIAEQPEVRVRVSIGVGEFSATRHGNADHFLSEVDRALYRAKGGGRDRVCRASTPTSSIVLGQVIGEHG